MLLYKETKIAMIMICLCASLLVCGSVSMAKGLTTIKTNKTIKVDIDGDKKKEKILVKRKVYVPERQVGTKLYFSKYTLFINGKQALVKMDQDCGFTFKLVSVGGKNYIHVVERSFNDHTGKAQLYSCSKKHKLTSMVDFQKREFFDTQINSVENGKLRVKTSTQWMAVGNVSWYSLYSIKGKKIVTDKVCSSIVFPSAAKREMTLVKDVTFYTARTGGDEVEAKKGDKLTLVKIFPAKAKSDLQFKYGDKTVYLSVDKNNNGAGYTEPIFENVVLAG